MTRKQLFLAILGLSAPFIGLADTFSGRVVDETGCPLIGATVRSVNGRSCVATDADGRFSIEINGNIAKLHVSFIGFAAKTVTLRSEERDHDLKMTPDMGELEEVVVTATRTPKAIKDVPVVTRLITSDDIRKTDASNIQDLLSEELPGLEFSYTMSQETSLNMSGFGGKAVLFLVDGERLAGETLDNIDFNRLNLDNVGRVEVVKGASSALYGANAVGGVVNLITRDSKEPWRVNLNSRYRALGNEWRSGADINFNKGKWTSNTNIQYLTSETVKLTDAFDTESYLQHIFGGRTVNLKERIVFRPSDNLRLIARGGYFNRVSERINYDDHYLDYAAGLRGEWYIGPGQSLEFSYSYDQYDKQRYINGYRTHDHDYSNRQNILHALYTHYFGKNSFTAGTDYIHDYLMTYQFLNGSTHSQSSFDAFVQFDYNPAMWLNLVASVREDYFSESRNNSVTARVATLLKFNRFSVRVNYSGGFRAPTLKEMYMNFDMAGIQMIYGNQDLKPEKSHNFNLALEYCGNIRNSLFAGSYSLTAMGYYNIYDSRITTTDFPGNSEQEAGAVYCNEDGVKVSGVDFSARYRMLNGVGMHFNYNYLRMPGRKVDSQFSNPRPHSMTWRLDYEKRVSKVYKFYAALSGRYLGKPESMYATDSSYSTWKLTIQQEIWHGISLNLIVDNLTNYRPKVYYWNSLPTLGRTWSLGVSLDIDKIIR